MPLEFHEPRELLPPEVIEQHRAIASLIEELEAAAWYHDRAAVSNDEELKTVMEHNRDEELEHAAMLLERIRRRIPKLDEELRTYLFTTAPITQIEELEAPEPGAPGAKGASSDGSLGIGSMKEGE